MTDRDARTRTPIFAGLRRVKLAVTLLFACAAVAGLALGGVHYSKVLRARRVARRHLAGPALARAGGPAVDFAREVQPILSENCVKCHGADKHKGEFRLDVREEALKGGESGVTAIVPGDADGSDLVRRIASHEDDEMMPPKGERLAAAKVEVLRRWVNQGAVWPASAQAAGVASPGGGFKVTDEDRRFWAFRPISKIEIPATGKGDWAVTAIDRFLLSAQEGAGLHPNPPASKRVLIRRLYFDLVGLPPLPEEVDAFERDEAPDAYERLVDRLLASPHFGERWGRHWLDAARYADSAGYEEDRPRPNAFHYRDFVIKAANEDLPYDRFIRWQIAGDLLAPRNPDALAATGFVAAAPDVRPDFINFRKKDRCDELDDIVSTTGSAVLGLTLRCARCHDHKFDPVPMAEYYRMTAFFTSTVRDEQPLNAAQGAEYERKAADYKKRFDAAEKQRKEWQDKMREAVRQKKIEGLKASNEEKALLRAAVNDGNLKQRQLLKQFEDELDIRDDVVRGTLSKADAEKWDALDAGLKAMEATKPADIPRVLMIHDGPPQKTFILARGDPDRAGAEVTPGPLSVLLKPESGGQPLPSSTRGDLARWLTDDVRGAGALVARVAVNRLWQHHFGRGLVATPGDFGHRGDLPSNPELLDWLAGELIRGGWRMKPLHKMIVMSAAYRQSIETDSAREAIDPADRLEWRRQPARIESEILRDAILSVSGRLNLQMYGPAVKPWINTEAIAITNPAKRYDEWPKDVVDGPETRRRSIYIFEKRANLFPFLQTFDSPTTIGSCTRRDPTTVAPQALALMNDKFVRQEARAFAGRLTASGALPARVATAFELAFARKPEAEELAKSVQFIDAQTEEYRKDSKIRQPEAAALCDFCQAIIASNEFSYID